MPSVVFRTEASPAIGGGHVMRCLTLANQLRNDGWDTSFCCSNETYFTIPQLKSSGHKMLDSIISKKDATDWLVIDHYGLGLEYEKSCRSHAKQILVFDDLPTRAHDCDILVDQNLGRTPEDYQGLVPKTAFVATGTAFAVLRSQFASARMCGLSQNRLTDSPLRLMIAMGLTDPDNATELILNILKKNISNIRVNIVLGGSAPHLEKIRKKVFNLPFVTRIYTNVTDMAGLLAKTDLVIGAAGSSAWERCCLGIPALIVVLAENQRRVADALDEKNIAINLGSLRNLKTKEAAEKIYQAIESQEQLATLARNAAKVCDGLGARRVALLLDPEKAKDGKSVQLRPASEKDASILLTWQSLPETRRYFHNPSIPTRDEHYTWFMSKLADTTAYFHIIEHHGEPAGVLRLEKKVNEEDTFEVNILIAPSKYRLGIAKAALLAARRIHTHMTMVAEAFPDNLASNALFKTTGFLRKKNLYTLRPKQLVPLHKKYIRTFSRP